MNDWGVTEQKAKQLLARMDAVGLCEDDISEVFVKGSGRGGQKVNKSVSAVQLRHSPTGVVVKCSSERERGLNRFFARRMLCEQLEIAAGVKTDRDRRIEKIRKSKKRRRRRSSSAP